MCLDDWAAVDWPTFEIYSSGSDDLDIQWLGEPSADNYNVYYREPKMLDVTTHKQFKLFELVLLDWQLTRMHEEKPLKRYLDYRELVRAEIWQRLGPILSEGKE